MALRRDFAWVKSDTDVGITLPGTFVLGPLWDMAHGVPIAAHNAGKSTHTSKHRPWHLETVIGFDEKARAIAFEHYLKSGSGFAFAKRHF